MTRLLLTLRILLVRAGFAVGRRRPISPRVVLATAHSSTATGNLRWLRDDLARRHPDIAVRHLVRPLPRGTRGYLAYLWSLVRSGFELATARAFVLDDYFFPLYVISPRQGTTRVQVWHATGAFKKFGHSVLDRAFGADAELVRRVRIHSNYSVALVSSMSIAPHYAEAFGQPLDIFTSYPGIPRTDLFGDPALRAAAERRVRERYALPTGRRVVLYAPTFRGTSVRRARSAEAMDLGVMHEILGEDHVVLLKLHPFIRTRPDIPPALAGFVIDASDAPDVNELMLVSDILVTDYSSVIFEFALLGRPILFLTPDEDAYDIERGFYFDFRSDAPGPIFGTTAALAACIRAASFDLGRVRALAAATFDNVDGLSTRRVVDELLLPALAGRAPTAAALQARLPERRVG